MDNPELRDYQVMQLKEAITELKDAVTEGFSALELKIDRRLETRDERIKELEDEQKKVMSRLDRLDGELSVLGWMGGLAGGMITSLVIWLITKM